ncbi:outer membrane lipoprotein carrier protein LolA [candidate division KSB1 bacterium]|nr:outer membrane lipoprotein carrier protein LolA [candidate division KSB1 bacterium]
MQSETKTIKGVLFSLIGCLLFLRSIAGFGITGEDVINKVQYRFKKLKTFQADFKQVFEWKLAGETQILTGKIYLKKDDKFRLETEDQIFVSDGKLIWQYSYLTDQVIVEEIKKTPDSLLPRDLIFEYPKRFGVESCQRLREGKKRYFLLEMSPLKAEGFIENLKVWVDEKEYITRRIEFVDINENKTVYQLDNVILNSKIDDYLFKFHPPEGAELIDLR